MVTCDAQGIVTDTDKGRTAIVLIIIIIIHKEMRVQRSNKTQGFVHSNHCKDIIR